MKKDHVIVILIIVIFSSCRVTHVSKLTTAEINSSSFPPNSIEKQNWELTFHDEFNERKLDREKWDTKYYWADKKYNGRYHPQQPKEYFQDDYFEFTDSTVLLKADDQNVRVNDTILKYSSALLDNSRSFSQRLGYFEIRCKIPASPGFWPAFWLASKYSWPPEIDIFEFYTSRKNYLTTNLHYNTIENKKNVFQAFKIPGPAAGFHIYACEWTQDSVKWFFDNILIRSTTQGVDHLQFPMHIIINNAVEDPNHKKTRMKKAVFPNFFEVDYVRAYRKKEN